MDYGGEPTTLVTFTLSDTPEGTSLTVTESGFDRLPPDRRGLAFRMNEGGCDPHGRFYSGSMAYDQRPGAAALYRLHPDRSVRRVLDNVTVSNGLDWSPDDARVYYNDSAKGRVDVFDYDEQSGLGCAIAAPSPSSTTGGRTD